MVYGWVSSSTRNTREDIEWVVGLTVGDSAVLAVVDKHLQHNNRDDIAQVELRKDIASALVSEQGEGIAREVRVEMLARALANETGCGQMSRALESICLPEDYQIITETYCQSGGQLHQYSSLLLKILPEIREVKPELVDRIITWTLAQMSEGEGGHRCTPFEFLVRYGFGQTAEEKARILHVVREARRYTGIRRNMRVFSKAYQDKLFEMGTWSERMFVRWLRFVYWWDINKPLWLP